MSFLYPKVRRKFNSDLNFSNWLLLENNLYVKLHLNLSGRILLRKKRKKVEEKVLIKNGNVLVPKEVSALDDKCLILRLLVHLAYRDMISIIFVRVGAMGRTGTHKELGCQTMGTG